MKHLTIHWRLLAATLSWAAHGAVLIPDGDLNGVSDTLNLSTPVTEIGTVTITLTFSGVGDGGFNGDLYVTLSHDTGHAVLLNRVGRTADNAFGYSDSGISTVTLADAAANGDVHNYRLTLLGNRSTPLGGALTGTWQPDGRAVDPDLVFETSSRTATLSSFRRLKPNGDWTLFMADLSSGGQSQLESWSLEITPVPEPAIGHALAIACCFVLAGVEWLGRSAGDSRA